MSEKTLQISANITAKIAFMTKGKHGAHHLKVAANILLVLCGYVPPARGPPHNVCFLMPYLLSSSPLLFNKIFPVHKF